MTDTGINFAVMGRMDLSEMGQNLSAWTLTAFYKRPVYLGLS